MWSFKNLILRSYKEQIGCDKGSGVLEPAWENQFATISSQLRVQWSYVGSLKSAIVGVFTPQ